MRINLLLVAAIGLSLVGMAVSQDLDFESENPGQPAQPAAISASSMNDDGSVAAHIVCIDEVDVTLGEAGILTAAPSEGQLVEDGEVIAKTDDQDAMARRLIAYHAWKAVEKELESDIRIKYATAQSKMYKASYDDAVEANQRQRKTISANELRRRRFEWEGAEYSIENNQHDMEVTEITALEKKAEYDAATLMLRHHEVKAPIGGIVEQRFLGKGSYVRPGDIICRIVRLDRLRAQARVPFKMMAPAELKGRPVTVKVIVDYSDGQPIYEEFPSQIGFVSPNVDVINNIRVWAEIENRNDFVVRKGMQARIEF